MDFDELMVAMQEFVGQEVALALSPRGDDGTTLLGITGILVKSSPAAPFVDRQGRSLHGDQAITYLLPPHAGLTVTRRRHRGGGWSAHDGHRFLWFSQGEIVVSVGSPEATRALYDGLRAAVGEVERPPAD